MEVYKAIAAVAGEMAAQGISKNSKNQQQGYNFRGIDDVYNALAPMLARHNLVILPRCVERGVVERQTAKGGNLFYVTVRAEFDFVSAIDGSKHTVATYGEAMDSADKATNKAMSAAYKYAAFQAFCIPTEETAMDADAVTHPATTRAPIDLTPYFAAMDAAKSSKELGAAAKAAWEATNDDRITDYHTKVLNERKAAAKAAEYEKQQLAEQS
jgi:hypothetical protein